MEDQLHAGSGAFDDMDIPARSCTHETVRPGWLTASDRRELRAWFALDGLVASWDDGPVAHKIEDPNDYGLDALLGPAWRSIFDR